jgi:hypothetical protein
MVTMRRGRVHDPGRERGTEPWHIATEEESP